MLYKKNNTPKLDMELYKNPTSEYRAAPFWAWNCELIKEELEWQIEVFKEMGFGGFHMHTRSGMATEYLGKEFMDLVKACRDKAEKEDMLAWLYDEDRWPSGYAGGYVTKNKTFRQKWLIFTGKPVKFYSKEEGIKEGLPYLLGVFDVELENGFLKSYRMIDESEPAKHLKRYAYVTTPESTGRFNGHTYVDTMCKEAIKEFINITHEAYKEAVGESFDKSVPAIFTDEPYTTVKRSLGSAESDEDAVMPWTTDFGESYMEKYGEDIISKIPELFLDLPDGRISITRYRFHDYVVDKYIDAFSKPVGTWCKENGIALTGHLDEEQTLESQTHSLGEAMRPYEWFTIPGIDMLCNRVQLTTAKQAQSAVHQYGREAMLSELYGVTNWDFDFRGFKFQGDWQAAMGVTVRAPHLSWASMKGSAKRDYPPSISYHSPWYKEYKYIEDHFARLNTVLTRGKPLVNVGVIHPIESFWMYYGAQETTSNIRNAMDKNFVDITRWLAEGMVEYDFISESLLPKQCKNVSDKLNVGAMNYGTILVPDCRTIRRTTFNLLKEFAQKGGKLIFAGGCPKFIDAVPTDEVEELYNKSVTVEYDRTAILSSLEDDRTVEITDSNGKAAMGYIHSLRQDGDVKWFFLARDSMKFDWSTSIINDADCARSENLTLVFDGEYTVKLFNTTDGTVENIEFETKNGKTYVYRTFYNFDSLLLQLTEGRGEYKISQIDEKVADTIKFIKNVEYKRDEDNVLVLDIAKYKFDDGEWQDEEELLKIDKKCRKIIDYPLADGRDKQPYLIPKEEPEHYFTMLFEFESEAEISNVSIAGEEAEYIKLNCNDVPLVPNGYYIDKSIKRYDAGPIVKGKNTVEIKSPITKRIGLEHFFLLGDFDVRLRGCEKTILQKSEKIGFADITSQGMPFYGGNVIYKTEINVPESTLKIRVNRYRGALVKVFVDGKDVGNIVYPPYILKVDVPAGTHKVEFMVYGNRINTIGQIHDTSHNEWVWPESWYTENYEWSYEYELRATGIISSPVIEVIEK